MAAQRAIPIQVQQDNLATAILMAVFAAGAAWAAADVLAWGVFNILQGGEFSAGVASAWHAILPFQQGGEEGFERVRVWLSANRPGWLGMLTWVPRVMAATAGLLTFAYFKKSLEKNFTADRHIRGRRVLEGQEALAAWARAEGQADGLRPHPSLPLISTMRETRHFLIVGGVGSGKTQTLLPLIFSALARGDRLFIFDNKGDFSASLPKSAATAAALLAPWDKRSKIWDVARDVATESAAREFAARMIVEPGGSNNPMWSNAARQILTACVVELQTESPGKWGFADLIGKLDRPTEELTTAARRYFPEAIKALGDGQQKNVTVAGIEINLHSFISVLRQLAQAWPKPPAPGRGFSVRDWLSNPKNPFQTCLVQHNGEFESLARAFNGAILSLASQLVNSPLIGESRERRLWFFLDEFPQLGKVESVFPLAEIGRSKGVRLVVCAQDFSQIKKIYSAEQTDALMSMVGTHVIARVSAGETADYVCKHLIGDREIERPELSTSGGVGQRSSRTQTTRIVREPVMLPAELSRLGPTKTGVRVMWLGIGADALITELPFTSAQAHRPASVIAAWTQHPAPAPLTMPAPVPAVSPPQQQPAQPAAQETEKSLQPKEKPLDTTDSQNVVSTTGLASAGLDFLDDFISGSPLARTDNPDGDEAGEGDMPAQSPLSDKAEIVDTHDKQNDVSTPESNKIILLPPASVATTAAAEAAKEGLAEPLEKAAVHALGEVLSDPLGLLIQAGEILSDVEDAAALVPAPDVQIIPGGEQTDQQPEKKKRRFKKKAETELEHQP